MLIVVSFLFKEPLYSLLLMSFRFTDIVSLVKCRWSSVPTLLVQWLFFLPVSLVSRCSLDIDDVSSGHYRRKRWSLVKTWLRLEGSHVRSIHEIVSLKSVSCRGDKTRESSPRHGGQGPVETSSRKTPRKVRTPDGRSTTDTKKQYWLCDISRPRTRNQRLRHWRESERRIFVERSEWMSLKCLVPLLYVCLFLIVV